EIPRIGCEVASQRSGGQQVRIGSNRPQQSHHPGSCGVLVDQVIPSQKFECRCRLPVRSCRVHGPTRIACFQVEFGRRRLQFPGAIENFELSAKTSMLIARQYWIVSGDVENVPSTLDHEIPGAFGSSLATLNIQATRALVALQAKRPALELRNAMRYL